MFITSLCPTTQGIAHYFADPHYLDADWVGKELGWRPELVEAARKLIAELNA